MGNQEMLAELPPVEWTEAEDAEWLRTYNDGRSAPTAAGRTFYSSFSEALNNFRALVCRERQLRESLAQLRAANERAEAAERSRDVWQRCCAKLSAKREDLEAKQAAVPDAEGAD